MRTTIRLRDDLLQRAREKAAKEGRTLTALVEEGLMIVLSEAKETKRSRIRLPVSKASGGLSPGVDLNRLSDLADIMDT